MIAAPRHAPGRSMKQDLNALTVFARVARMGSFTAAARALDMPKATVSSMVASLERQLGTRLLERTTRRVSLSEAGRVFLASCERVLEEVDNGRSAVEALSAAPRGRLRVCAPFALSRSVLGPLLPAFCARYPDLRVSLDVNNRAADLLGDDSDVALRVGPLPEKAGQVHRITVFSTQLIASRSYVARRGRPRVADDLLQHDLIGRTDRDGQLRWVLRQGDRVAAIEQQPRLGVNDPDTAAALIARDCGIGWLPSFLSRDGLAEGRLVRCLPDWDAAPVELNALLPSAHTSSPKALALIGFLREAIGPAA